MLPVWLHLWSSDQFCAMLFHSSQYKFNFFFLILKYLGIGDRFRKLRIKLACNICMINLTSTTFFTDEDGEIETKSLNSILQIILPLVRIFCGTFLHICRGGSCYKMLVLAYSLVYYIISVIFILFYICLFSGRLTGSLFRK